MPKFRLPGGYAVEVSMNGKHFTSNERVFTVFKRPQVAAVSVFDTRFSGEEEITMSLCGSLRRSLGAPLCASCAVESMQTAVTLSPRAALSLPPQWSEPLTSVQRA